MKLVRCRICGETYLGAEVPVACPFCGAHARFLVTDGSFDPAENELQLTEVERADLEQALEIERANARFYAGVATLPGHNGLASAYKRLSRIEAEHCSVFSKLLHEPKPTDLGDPDAVPTTWAEAIAESEQREDAASGFYADAASRATNTRIKEVFTAIAGVEVDHLAFDGIARDLAPRT